MLGSPKLRKFVSLLTAAQGLFALLLPKRAARLAARLTTGFGFSNVGDLEPKDWYVDSTRATGAGMLISGLVGFLLAERAADDGGLAAEDALADDDETADDDGGPIDIGIDAIEDDD